MQIGFQGNTKNAVFDPDPRAKFAMLLAVNIIMISGGSVGVEYVLRIICAVLPFVLLLSIRNYRTALIYFILLGAAVYCEGMVLPHTHGAAGILLMIPCGILTRFMTGYMMCWYTVRSTSVSEFVTAMEKMHVWLCKSFGNTSAGLCVEHNFSGRALVCCLTRESVKLFATRIARL